MTKIIGIVQLKGGAGRSTIATNLAAALSRKGTTAIIDCDIPQGTTASWYALREAEGKADNLTLATAGNHVELLTEIEKLEDQKYIVLDAPPRIAEITRAILMLADLLLIPLTPSAAEIWATTDLLETIEEARQQRPELKARIVWNKYRQQTRSAQELSAAVKQEIKTPALKSHLGHRVGYSEALARGLAGDEWPDKNIKAEIQALTTEIEKLMRA
jgi:chromosome partitioning protein